MQPNPTDKIHILRKQGPNLDGNPIKMIYANKTYRIRL